MNLTNLKNLLSSKECKEIYVKKLSENDNSKNQVYFARGSWELLNVLPVEEIKEEAAGVWEKERFKARLNFSWINDEGKITPAPNSQLILYPKYPEIRFSGFLKGAKNAPSTLMCQRLVNRLLFITVTNKGEVLGYVAHPDSQIAREFEQEKKLNELGVFKIISLPIIQDSRELLIQELLRIYYLDWIVSKRLDSKHNILPCRASNCGGYTLEAELGITPNGYSEPDFLGWEIKNFGVKNFSHLNSSRITLMTPEPTDGIYKHQGIEYFIRKYGYPDKKGRMDRFNFGGIHKNGKLNKNTNLELRLIGFDYASGNIRNSNGKIILIDGNEDEAASWSFSSMLLHWNKKHNKACYVPSILKTNGDRKYKFGNKVFINTGTNFQLFLSQVANGNVFYDPGIKMVNVSSNRPKIKKRSQFRIVSKHIPSLYFQSELVSILNKH